MSQILVRNVEPGVLDALRRRARENGTSAEEEARRALAAAVTPGLDGWRARAEALAGRLGRLPGPDSTELLRKARDRDEHR